MRPVTVIVSTLFVAACVPRSRPASPTQPVIADTQPATATTSTSTPTPAPTTTTGTPSTTTYRDLTLFAQPQPQPQPPQPYPAPAPATQAPGQQPQSYPPPPPQPYGPQPQPQPYGPQPQPQPPPAPYGYPPPAPPPAPLPAPSNSRRVLHDGEVISDFAAVGVLAATDILIRQDVGNGGVGTLVMLSGIAGGGALGWLLTDRYTVDAGAARATTIGLLAGTANAALVIRPSEAYDPADVIALLFFGGAAGAVGGFAYGQAADLTSGQSTFLGNAILLGTATATVAAITGSRNGKYDNWENGTLALGLDAGLIGGALIAPKLDWSPRRAKIVLSATLIGALIGGMLPGLVTKRQDGEDYNGDLIAGCMTAGLWAGFGIGIAMTRDSSPDSKYLRPPSAPVAPTVTAPAARSTSYAPYVGDHGQIGLMAAGTW